LSTLDAVEELCLGLAHGHRPEVEWAEIVERTFAKHRAELRDPEGHEAEVDA
jgi:hypothetical protein